MSGGVSEASLRLLSCQTKKSPEVLFPRLLCAERPSLLRIGLVLVRWDSCLESRWGDAVAVSVPLAHLHLIYDVVLGPEKLHRDVRAQIGEVLNEICLSSK